MASPSRGSFGGANMLSKMKHGTKPGSRIAEVHNGSSLFTGDAGQGESNIRRWIIENDWLEAIVALPPVESRTSWGRSVSASSLGRRTGPGIVSLRMSLNARDEARLAALWCTPRETMTKR
jgi:hypothetical protein